ncbi:hypothetical protein [Pseudobacillus badius]|uniref:hypothetical protein n=1 Tax=Bacillus badius TaxID=1455 RepID=UPI0007B3E95D|nr:hypothetical protein [Bacillus badius]KZR59135.1 hypothetical protein A3781_01105 [Bacillus badius]
MGTAIAVVEFQTGYKRYEFKTDLELSVGDVVVVDATPGISVATVVGLKDTSKLATKWVIQKVDLTVHEERLAKEKKLKEIREKMEARRKELQEIQIYQLLAQEDEGMAALLNEYQKLA